MKDYSFDVSNFQKSLIFTESCLDIRNGDAPAQHESLGNAILRAYPGGGSILELRKPRYAWHQLPY